MVISENRLYMAYVVSTLFVAVVTSRRGIP